MSRQLRYRISSQVSSSRAPASIPFRREAPFMAGTTLHVYVIQARAPFGKGTAVHPRASSFLARTSLRIRFPPRPPFFQPLPSRDGRGGTCGRAALARAFSGDGTSCAYAAS
eukprot:7363928-Pyramimonas_sp.AAC.1